MSVKVKLVSCIVGMLVAIGMLVVGVMAVTSQDIFMQGNVNFVIADNTLYVRDVRYQHGMNAPQNVPGFRQGFINGGFDLNMSNVDFGDNTTGTFVLYFDIINFVVDGTTHEYVASAFWTDTTVSGVSYSIDAGSEKIEEGTIPPENLTDSTPISGSVALEIFVNNAISFDLSNITISFNQTANLDEVIYVINDDGSITINGYTGTCTNLAIPESYTIDGVVHPVTAVGENAFQNSTELQSMILPDTITDIGQRAFKGCSNLTTINLPEGLTIINREVFSYCTNLTNVILPQSLTGIMYDAFFRCENAFSVLIISNKVTSIGVTAFSGCKSLKKVIFQEDSQIKSIPLQCFYNCINLTEIVLPSGLEEISTGAFTLCYSLKEITIPKKLTLIPKEAFMYCRKLEKVIYEDGSRLQTIGKNAFCGCESLTAITIPDNVTSIDKSAFNGCHKLASITVSAGNTIYHSAGNAIIETATKTLVQGCQTTIIPDDGSVISIGDSAFYDINGLTSITIPDSVISMGNYAFFSCYYLNSVTIGSGITSIGDSAFSMCNTTRLTITVNATTPPTLGNSAISAKQILVPAESVDAYKAASGWSSYADKISAIAA